MSYRVEFHAKASAETLGLPEHAFRALVDTLVAVSRDPVGRSSEDLLQGDGAFRWAPFGAGFGIVQLHVDDRERRIVVYNVTWTG